MRRTTRKARKEKSLPSATAPPALSAPPSDDALNPGGADDPVSVSNLSVHELFEQQTRSMLERADLDEEQKQSILVALACPCCGTGAMSFSMKLKRK